MQCCIHFKLMMKRCIKNFIWTFASPTGQQFFYDARSLNVKAKSYFVATETWKAVRGVGSDKLHLGGIKKLLFDDRAYGDIFVRKQATSVSYSIQFRKSGYQPVLTDFAAFSLTLQVATSKTKLFAGTPWTRRDYQLSEHLELNCCLDCQSDKTIRGKLSRKSTLKIGKATSKKHVPPSASTIFVLEWAFENLIPKTTYQNCSIRLFS